MNSIKSTRLLTEMMMKRDTSWNAFGPKYYSAAQWKGQMLHDDDNNLR